MGHKPGVTGKVEGDAFWRDDAIEIFVDPTHSHKQELQFIVNAGGVRSEQRNRDKSFDVGWEPAVWHVKRQRSSVNRLTAWRPYGSHSRQTNDG